MGVSLWGASPLYENRKVFMIMDTTKSTSRRQGRLREEGVKPTVGALSRSPMATVRKALPLGEPDCRQAGWQHNKAHRSDRLDSDLRKSALQDIMRFLSRMLSGSRKLGGEVRDG